MVTGQGTAKLQAQNLVVINRLAGGLRGSQHYRKEFGSTAYFNCHMERQKCGKACWVQNWQIDDGTRLEGIRITLRNQKLPDETNKVVCGWLFTPLRTVCSTERWNNMQGKEAWRIYVKTVCYWDWMSAKAIPTISVAITKDFNNNLNPPVEWRVGTASETVLVVV